MLQDRRVFAAAAKDWVWTLNNPTAEGGRAPPVTGPALCLLGVRQRGWTTRQRQQKLDRTPIFFNSVNTLTTMYQYLRRERGQIIGEQNPMLVMFTSYTEQITKENILADLNNPDRLVTVVLCTSALSVGVSVNCKT